MDIFLSNFKWMAENVGLALAGVVFCFLFLRTKNNFIKLISFVLWVVFVPNTIYLITDMQHLPKQLTNVGSLFKFFLIIQYFVLIGIGVITYIASVYPIEEFFEKNKKDKKYTALFIFLFNFLIAFGVAIGKVQRTNSADVITNPAKVLLDFYTSAASVQIMLFVVVFGLVLNVLYFYVIRSLKIELSKIFK